MSEWSIQELAKSAGTTSRTLRHYGDLGLLEPSRIGANGYRFYDEDALVRLQRILLLRELGLGLPAIAEVLTGERDTAAALRTHLELLEQERTRISRQIESVNRTLNKTKNGESLMPEDVSTGSTTPDTRTRSSSAGARTPTPAATTGGGRCRSRTVKLICNLKPTSQRHSEKH